MDRQCEFDIAGAKIIGNARFLANEFRRGILCLDSETVMKAFEEIIRLDEKRVSTLKAMIDETHQ